MASRSVLDPQVATAIADARTRAGMTAAQLAAADVQRPSASPNDQRDVNLYFLMADRFANPSAASASQAWNPPLAWDHSFGSRQDGTLAGITRQLPYVRDLGIAGQRRRDDRSEIYQEFDERVGRNFA